MTGAVPEVLTVAAVLTVGLAAALSLPPRPTPPGKRRVARPGGLATVLLGGSVVGAAVTLADLRELVLAMTVVGVVAGVLRLAGRRRAAARRRTTAGAVTEACDLLAAELRAGLPPLVALQRVAADLEVLRGAAASGALGGDVPHALRRAAERPGCERLAALAAAWEVSNRTGSPLSGVVARQAATGRRHQRLARLVAAEIAAARATAWLLTLLPVGLLGVSGAVGGDPAGFLFGTWPGVLCLAGGVALSVTGLSWLDRVAAQVESS